MKPEEFVKLFAAQFDETDAAEFRPETEFRKLDEWSSLTALSVIAMIDEEYGVQIKGEDIRQANTILELFEKVKAKA